jgi:hypothetical protein
MDLRLELRRTIKLVVPSPKGDLVSVVFLSRHFRAGLWILPSLPGLVCGNDLWPGRCEKIDLLECSRFYFRSQTLADTPAIAYRAS